MLRRALFRRHKHTYAGKHGAAAIDGDNRKAPQTPEEEERYKSGRVHEYTFDPIANDNDFKARQEQSKFGAINQGSSMQQGYAQHNEVLTRWMKVNTAAQILGLQEKQLYATKPGEIEDAWRKMYMKAANEKEREEIMAAADVLMDYASSDEAKERTKQHFHDVLTKAKRDIDGTFKQDKEDMRSRLLQGATAVQLTVTFGLVGAMWLMYTFLDLDDGRNMAERAKRRYTTAMSQPTNTEPGPNYVTRYRDTPTSFDERAKQGYIEVTDPGQRQALLGADEVQRREEGFIAQISCDMRGPGAKERIEARRQERDASREAMDKYGMLQVAESLTEIAPSPIMQESRGFDTDGRNKAAIAAIQSDRLAAATAAVAASAPA